MPSASLTRGMSPSRLRILLAVLFVGLALPAVVLVRQGFGQLELETFRQQQLLAESAARRIDAALASTLLQEEARPFEDFSYASPVDGGLARSPLSRLPVSGGLPGTLGYFQVDTDGALTTPILPAADDAAADLAPDERAARAAIRDSLLAVLAENRLVRERSGPAALEQPDPESEARAEAARKAGVLEEAVLDDLDVSPAAATAGADRSERTAATAPGALREELRGQAGFDRLRQSSSSSSSSSSASSEPARSEPQAIASFADSGVGAAADGAASPAANERETVTIEAEDESAVQAARRQVAAETSASAAVAVDAPVETARRIATFAGELEPFQFSRLDTGHFVLYRNAWRDGERFVQGALVDQPAFVAGAVRAVFDEAGLAPGTRLTVSDGAATLAALSTPLAADSAGRVDRNAAALLSARLSPPFAALELSFDAGLLPRGPAYRVLVWTAITLFGVLIAGLYAVYHFGLRQLELARTQQNFVSAVSHELKTPLTSIRMYGEMLKSGWAGEDKKQSYYDFIYAEGERLSRLIDNVLELARLDRNGRAVKLEPMTVASLLDLVESKTATQLELAGLELLRDCDDRVAALEIAADPDAVAQIFINLVDNAIKFAAAAEPRRLLLRAAPGGRGLVELCLRDYGPGIPPAAMKRLFELFYRPDNELTRNTAGTGIGLALVKQLAAAMGGRVDVRNADPGAEFRLLLRLADAGSAARPASGQ